MRDQYVIERASARIALCQAEARRLRLIARVLDRDAGAPVRLFRAIDEGLVFLHRLETEATAEIMSLSRLIH